MQQITIKKDGEFLIPLRFQIPEGRDFRESNIPFHKVCSLKKGDTIIDPDWLPPFAEESQCRTQLGCVTNREEL